MALQKKVIQTGSHSGQSWSNGYVITLILTEESMDVDANSSCVSYRFTISNTDNNHFTQNNQTWSIFIGGQEIRINNFNFDLGDYYTTQTIASGQVTVPHNADGTLNMPYNVSIPDIKTANKYGPPAMALSGTWALTSIPRASAVFCPVGTIGKPVTVSIRKAGEELSHTVIYRFGNLQGTVVEQTQQSQVSWSIPTEFYTQIPNTRRGGGALICQTYSGDTLVGESSCQFYADIDETDCRPVISPQVEDVNSVTTALTGDGNTFIRYYSDAYVDGAYSAKNSATVASCAMTHNGKAYTDAAVTITDVENGVFDFSVTDSRGLTANLSVTKPVIPYIKLTCDVENSKMDAEGNILLSVSGNYFAGSFGAKENTLTLQYRYKLRNASWSDTAQWHTMEPVITEDGYTAQTIVTGLNHQKLYTFQVRAVDQLDEAEATMYAAKATPVFDWGEEDFQFHVPVGGITPEMVGIRYKTNDGTSMLQNFGVEAGLLFVRDAGNTEHYYLGVFGGYRYRNTPHFYTLSANVLDVTINATGTVSATGLTGEATCVIIPFITI